MADLVVAGAGMAGLVAAAHARERGASVLLLEKGPEPGGSMALSSGWIWRYRKLEEFRAQCPGGDPTLQWTVWERLDDDLAWLETIAGPAWDRDTGNPLTTGARFDPRSLTQALVARVGEILCDEPLRRLPSEVPVVLATGGFQGNRELVRRYVTAEAEHLILRANPWSAGDALELAVARGAELSNGMDEFYGRNLPAAPHISPAKFVALAQLYARFARVENERGEAYEPKTWSEIDVVQWTARQPGASAWYVVPETVMDERVRERSVRDMIDAARDAGARVDEGDGETRVPVRAGITTTLGGLRIDADARVTDGLYAAGADAGGISTGGYSSGLAAALVFGRIAAESALRS